MRFLASFRATNRGPLLQVAKTGLAIALSWLAATALLQVEAPIFAAIAAVLVVLPSVNQSFERGIERSIGVIIGVLIAIGIQFLWGSSSWIILGATIFSLFLAWVLKVTAGTANQMAISSMLVLALGSTGGYAVDRILETLLGCVIGIIVNALIVPPVQVEPARLALERLGAELAAAMDRLAGAVSEPRTSGELQALMIEARLLRPMEAAAKEAIAEGRDSLRMNPRRSRHRGELQAMQALLDDVYRSVINRVIGMTRATLDHHNETVPEEPAVHAIAEQLHRAAHDLRLRTHLADVDPVPLTTNMPVLTAPLTIQPPRSENWVLIGSLTEDLRRIREVLVGDDA